MTRQSILIIEDDATMLRGLVDNFAAQGYDVLSANDGAAGLCQALSESVDLVVLDIMLPKMNGYEICQKLRERDRELPIIMLTAKGQEEDIIRGLNLGADDYVTKPFSIRELLARAAAHLRRRSEPEAETYRFGQCIVDLVSHRLLREGTEVALTPKEFRLLEYFVKRPGRALARNDVINHVWGRSIIVTARSVDRCISTLRSKIEPDPRNPTHIQTIRDIGYRFEGGEGETKANRT